MAKKSSLVYKCSSCGNIQPRWLGRCPECNEWNTFEECIVKDDKAPRVGIGGTYDEKGNRMAQKPVKLSSINPLEGQRLNTGIDEFDRVLGGGAMLKSAILIGGEPGIGKSTLLLQTASSISKVAKGNVLYISGEESASQIRSRADRLMLDCSNIQILCTSHLDDIESALNSLNPIFCVIDSIQTVFSPDAGVVPGTVNQLKYCANELISWVKEHNSVMLMVAHITKDGVIAGPKSLEHMVDTVISFEKNNDDIRFLRSHKNRFGSIDELGIFQMHDKGLIPVEDTSSMFITQRSGKLPAGVAIVSVFEGSRVFMVEIQALTVPAKASLSRVYSDKIDNARVSRVAAVIEKCLGLKFSDQDLYINVAGGIKLSESAIDAALCSALYSARTGIAFPEDTVVVGELSLAGEIRPVSKLKQRVKTAKNLGFNNVIAPESEEGSIAVKDIKSMLKKLFG
ncbi:MAG: DNA repair protein RadA [Treponemataceae bacterium]|nr:DNA repair protein RadA [Treponemataceae bacterium]